MIKPSFGNSVTSKYKISQYPIVSRTLESIAKKFPSSSREYKAIELAATALLFACSREVRLEFQRYLDTRGRELTSQQKRTLKKLGIDFAHSKRSHKSKLSV
jgi:hypothetical protein